MYICTECNTVHKKWFGQCPKCKSWNTVEQQAETPIGTNSKIGAVSKPILSLDDINLDEHKRVQTSIDQLDLVLGGGFVPGSLTLLGGRPGIGKSTLILKLADHIAKSNRVLYVSGEESLAQIKLRANRLDVKSDIRFLNEQNSHDIMATAKQNKVQLLIIDSVQTTASPNANSASGSVSQLKTIALELMEFAKSNNITVILIGHVTKDGDIAGPKLLEHMVDTVLYLEADNESNLRLIRAEKNRFGTTNEIGLLQMTNDGLIGYEQSNGRIKQDIVKLDGTAISGLKVGGRQMFVEVQALIAPTAYPSPKRSSQGVELSRLNIMLAILQKHMHIALNYDDVYVKIRGGLKTSTTGLDLALIASLYSAKREFPIASDELFIGEVTLAGEVLFDREDESIILAADKMGYSRVYANVTNALAVDNIEIVPVKHIRQMLEMIRG